MGCEFAQGTQWNFNQTLDWYVLDYPLHHGIQTLVKDLNSLYKEHQALHHYDFDYHGFEWIDCHDYEQSVISYRRKGNNQELIVVLNFTPIVRENYRIGVPIAGTYREILSSDSAVYAGSHVANADVLSDETPWMNLPHSIKLTLPPLGAIILKCQ
jgi:1,4-alpha-glucan branching enzyme